MREASSEGGRSLASWGSCCQAGASRPTQRRKTETRERKNTGGESHFYCSFTDCFNIDVLKGHRIIIYSTVLTTDKHQNNCSLKIVMILKTYAMMDARSRGSNYDQIDRENLRNVKKQIELCAALFLYGMDIRRGMDTSSYVHRP